ncbi:hypothetical protein LHFGNBLO_003788 [Mesorhizobium sp. AR10]|uniref:hypothetical protein n=1 Tax=Mesorhizobium sp. AR10 TaxID=2865839 RepID=UPI00215FFB5B|nr:hypothetical protein [Mesorhizobium sp. AR10]UVK36825.1 hypothetical protein LHFGNBLO_003788 [Mesorhizobium sp. AR10]
MPDFDSIKRRDWTRTYPTREQALALVAMIKSDDWETSSELDRQLKAVTGMEWAEDFGVVAERCFEVFGSPELEAGNRARRLAEVSMRPRKASSTTAAAPADTPSPTPQDAYGFTRRA